MTFPEKLVPQFVGLVDSEKLLFQKQSMVKAFVEDRQPVQNIPFPLFLFCIRMNLWLQ